MGISGLYSFIRTHPQGGRAVLWQPPFSSSDQDSSGQTTTFLVDGNALNHYILDQIQELDGESQKTATTTFYAVNSRAPWNVEFARLILSWVNRLRALGIHVIMVYDGEGPRDKIEEKLNRERDKINALSLRHHHSSRHEPSHKPWLSKLLPPFSFSTSIRLLRQAGVPVIMSVGEADAYIAHLAREMNAVVVSRDSDFYVHDVPSYINLNHLEFIENEVDDGEDGSGAEIVVDTTTTSLSNTTTVQPNFKGALYVIAHSASDIARMLGIPKAAIMIFACFLGCDYVSRSDQAFLNTLHPSLIKGYGVARLNKFLIFLRTVCSGKSRRLEPSSITQQQEVIMDWLMQDLKLSNGDGREARLRDIITRALVHYQYVPPPEQSPERALIHAQCQAGRIHPKLLDLCFQSSFLCALFNENVKVSESAWDLSSGIRKRLYACAARKFGCSTGVVKEYVRSGLSMMMKQVMPHAITMESDLALWNEQRCLAYFLTSMHCDFLDFGHNKGGDDASPFQLAPELTTVPPWMRIPVAVARTYIHEHYQSTGQRVSNLFLIAYLASCLLQLQHYGRVYQKDEAIGLALPPPSLPRAFIRFLSMSPTLMHLHVSAQLEGIAFSSYFLWQLLGCPSRCSDPALTATSTTGAPTDEWHLDEVDFWSFDPALFTACLYAIKQGKDWRESMLVRVDDQHALLAAYAAVVMVGHAAEGYVDVVVRL